MTYIYFFATIGCMNTDQIKHLAHLSRLHVSDNEIQEYTKQFDEIVAYVDKIKECANTTEVLESNAVKNVLREDKVISYKNSEQIINESPRHHDNFVQVKKILKQD